MKVLFPGKIISVSFVIVCLVLSWGIAFGQPFRTIDYQSLIDTLSLEIYDGNKKALRDLGTLLDKPAFKDQILEILKNASLFTKGEFDYTKTVDRIGFLSFYYDYESQIRFSELLRAFYITPIESQITNFKVVHNIKKEKRDPAVKLQRLSREFEVFLELGNDKKVLSLTAQIGNLRTNESYEFLLYTLRSQQMFNSPLNDPVRLCQQLAFHLIDYPIKECIQTILFLVELDILKADFAKPILEKMTNVSVADVGNPKLLVSEYEFLIDSTQTTQNLRAFGYQQELKFSKSFFNHEVDYYGMALSQADGLARIQHNALKDIIQTQHPRALFYIAGLAWRYRHNKEGLYSPEFFVNILEQLTDLKIAIEGANGLSEKQDWANDELACLNFLKYWATNYGDYEWDPIRKSYMNKEDAIELKESYERLFRRLNSQNDSVAQNAYLFLVEGDPVEVLALSRKYKELLRNYNATLPSFKHGYLEQLVQLTAFCRRIGAHYKPPHRMNQLLQQLLKANSPKERYHIENQIIARLAPDEVTALEFWGCMNEAKPEISFSVGRILDWFYSKHWNQIVENEEELRFYLKKAFLFKNIGVEGICKVYLNKFDHIPKDLQSRLAAILKIENDQDIIFQIKELQARINGGLSGSLIDFLEHPDWFSNTDIYYLPKADDNFYNRLFSKIEQSNNKYHQKAWLTYLQKNPSMEVVPKLFSLLEKDIGGTALVKVFEKTFDQTLKDGAKGWKNLWQSDSTNYPQWSKSFFEQRLNQLAKNDKQHIKEINAVVQSRFFDIKYKSLVLNALINVKPIRNIPRLRMEGLLSLDEDLNRFNEIPFGYKYLDDVPKLFNFKKDTSKMVDWLMTKARKYDVNDQGSFFNNLFQKNWFFDFVNDGKITDTLAQEIIAALQSYLQESEFISEFEEQTTITNITLLDNLGKTLEEKIQNTLRLDVDVNSKISIEEAILSRISFEDIPIVTKYLNDLSALQQYNFLNRDFGLPVFDLQNPVVQEELLQNFETMDPFELYAHYLNTFNIKFQNANGDLDFQKIYQILQYDIVMPFVGSGGKKRDLFTYGIIKLLELHFQTRLGFHEKLNENQTFYTYTASKRAQAWMQFLIENGHVEIQKGVTPSFNVMVNE